MRAVAVLSLKGGVGKTTVVLGLAGAAAMRGLRTLVVDLDPQANATVALGAEPTAASVADVLDEPRPAVLRRAIAASAWSDDLDVLVGSEETERHNHPDPGSKRLGGLARALSRLEYPLEHSGGSSVSSPANGHDPDPDPDPDEWDDVGAGEPYRLVIVDCPPSLGQLTRSALVAAHRAVLVTDPTMFAVAGVQRAFEAVQTERLRHNPDLQPLGVVVNRYRPRSAEHAYRINELRELFGPLVFPGVLPDRSSVQQAQGACMPIQQWDTPGAREVSAVFNSLLGRVLRSSKRSAVEQRSGHGENADDSLRDADEIPHAGTGSHP